MVKKRELITIHTMFKRCKNKGLANELSSNILIGVAFENDDSGNTPQPFPDELMAVWDTGATGTSITQSLADKLKLDKIGTVDICGVTGSCPCSTYLISLHLPNNVIIPEIEVAALSGDIGCDVLIGMDVINKGDFAVSNLYGDTTFTFRIPSIECLDFTQMVPKDAIGGGFINTNKTGRNELCSCGSNVKYKKCCLGKKRRNVV